MSLPSIAFIAFGLACIAFGLAHELNWFRRRGGIVVTGIIVEIIKDHTPSEGGPYYHPKIEYSIGEETHDFVSKYGNGAPAVVGTPVDVLLSSEGKEPEIVTAMNRLLFSVIPFVFGLVFIVIGFGIQT
jgi:hypothetical protein